MFALAIALAKSRGGENCHSPGEVAWRRKVRRKLAARRQEVHGAAEFEGTLRLGNN
jgi:hypothetical protein